MIDHVRLTHIMSKLVDQDGHDKWQAKQASASRKNSHLVATPTKHIGDQKDNIHTLEYSCNQNWYSQTAQQKYSCSTPDMTYQRSLQCHWCASHAGIAPPKKNETAWVAILPSEEGGQPSTSASIICECPRLFIVNTLCGVTRSVSFISLQNLVVGDNRSLHA